MMIFGSLFSGIGGFDLGFDRAGMACAWQVENDERCQDVLARHWPNVKRYGDVRDVGRNNLETVDLICGGFPCQDVSVAGKREGLAGERSGLWFEFHRVLEELKPGWVVVENVPGLLSSNGGRDFAAVLRGLVELGYGVAWRVLDAQYFGVAQRRRRVFVVGHLGDGRAAQVLFESEGGAWDTAPGREAGARFTAAFTERTRGNSRQLEYQEDIAYALDNPGNGGRAQTRLVAYSETGQGWWGDGIAPLRAQGERVDYPTRIVAGTWNTHSHETDDNSARLGHIAIIAQNGSDIQVNDKPGTVTAGQVRQTSGDVVCFQPRYYTRDNKTGGAPDAAADITNAHKAGDSAPHVAAFHWQAGGGGNDNSFRGKSRSYIVRTGNYAQLRKNTTDAVMGHFGVRRLTPTECERLQGFPDGHTDGQSDSARYRQLGNAVAVPVAEWIGKRVVRLD